MKWGSVELPELEYRPITLDPAKNHPEPGTVHLPTGMRLESTPGAYESRGEWVEYLLYGPPGEDWTMRLNVYGMSSLRSRVAKHLGLKWLSDLPPESRTDAVDDFLRDCGQEYYCDSFVVEDGIAPSIWTDEQRDAVLLMLFWSLDHPVPVHAKTGPYPSTIAFQRDVPDKFLGAFGNPACARLK